MKSLSVVMILCSFLTYGSIIPSTSVFEEFTISTADVVIYGHSESSLKLESQSPTYQLKLEPNRRGTVVFTLGRHGFTSTLMPKDIVFGVQIEGYRKGKRIAPLFNLDDTHDNVYIDSNFVAFQQIFEPIPVFFNSSVDSVKLIFSNSHSLDVHQYLSIDDLKIVRAKIVKSNPLLIYCEKQLIMFGIEGSSSIDKFERKIIAKQLMGFSKNPAITQDSNQICIMEFGKQVNAVTESDVKKGMVKNIKDYKKGKNGFRVKTNYTNWEAAFDRAIERRPNIFIFITDRWSNYANNGPESFNGQFETLVNKCNKLKSKGTRLLFITSGLSQNTLTNPSLYALLNKHRTNEIVGAELHKKYDLRQTDLISIDDFEMLEMIDFSSLLHCSGDPSIDQYSMKSEK